MANFDATLSDVKTNEKLNISTPKSIERKLFSSTISGTLLDFVIIRYSNRIFITITEAKKIGNLYTIRLDTPQRTGICNNAPAVFDIKCILGADSEEKTVAVRALVEKLGILQPVLLSLTISSFDYSTISSIAETILTNKCW